MYKVEIKLKNETGLHARPASLFVKEASKYSSDITIIKDGKGFTGKSIMGILSMGAVKGDMLIIEGKGEDEIKAVDALKALIESNFGE
ncbi:HPr family phosphocarrier protein [Wukongibacter sp. M2B1]|uniref:HPr family phosphocarrier protein n=1 Tax=Wukongibacter sp. M2B1 TaxID=3088895 RepID=UPI003D7BFE6F